MPVLRSLPPIISNRSNILILGSMPGQLSLAAGEYYAHPRNDFWPIIFSLLQKPLPHSYAAKIAMIKNKGIALWDVLATCTREGSSDQSIAQAQANNFRELFSRFPQIKAVFYNGRRAEQLFSVQGCYLPPGGPAYYLPSTSPAHTMTRRDKEQAWQIILKYFQEVKI